MRGAMVRIVYVGFPNGGVSGGQKMLLRHVEALQKMGFNAVYWTSRSCRLPEWLKYDAPVEWGTPLLDDDIIVLPEDAPQAIASIGSRYRRVLVFCQNHYYMAASSIDALCTLPRHSFLGFIASGRTIATSCARAFPDASVRVIPCFADERLFKPAPARIDTVAFVPRKRQLEARAIRAFFQRLYPHYRDLPWVAIDGMAEKQVAETLGRATLFLSLNRLEGVGMTLLEAMASGCVAAGFTGLGAREFTTPTNGFWVEEDDCEAAADALARAADLVRQGGAGVEVLKDAAYETASRWTYARFHDALEEVWSELAPDARINDRQIQPGY